MAKCPSGKSLRIDRSGQPAGCGGMFGESPVLNVQEVWLIKILLDRLERVIRVELVR